MKLLLPFSLFFRALVAIRNAFYDYGLLQVNSLPGTVISVGNLAVGGTGKSPLVQFVVAQLVARGKRPVILTRGYKSGLRRDEFQILLNGQVVAGVVRSGVQADEALMQSAAQPDVFVVVGAKRHEAACWFLEKMKESQPTHWVLDDGFQHRTVHRDLNIVAIDARSPWGPCFPAGLFREPKSALRRADVVVLTKAETEAQAQAVREQVQTINPTCRVYQMEFKQEALKRVSGKSESPTAGGQYIVVCGIAKPLDFVNALRRMGLDTGKVFQYPDHRSFDPVEVRPYLSGCQGVITTAKDWARDGKLFGELGVPIFVAPIKVVWVGQDPDFSR